MSVNVYFYNSQKCDEISNVSDTLFCGIGNMNQLGCAWMDIYQGGLYAYNGPRMEGNIQLITAEEILNKWDIFKQEVDKYYPQKDNWNVLWKCMGNVQVNLLKLNPQTMFYVDAG